MSFDLEENFGEAGAGLSTPSQPSVKSILEAMGGALDAALMSEADLSGTSSSVGYATVSGVAAGSELSVTGIAEEDTLLNVLVLENGDVGSVTDVKSVELERAEIAGADSVALEGVDTTDDLVLVSYLDAS